MGTDSDGDWRARAAAQHAAQLHAAADARERAREATQARELVTGFVREARARGLRTSQLRAMGYDGRATYRTRLRGWYLKRDRSLAAGVDGELYLLAVPPAFLARLTGVTPTPYEPRMVIGRGGRDGESIPLQALLARRLDAGDDWP